MDRTLLSTDVVAEFLGPKSLDMFVPEGALVPEWDHIYNRELKKDVVGNEKGNVLRDLGDWNPRKIANLEPEFVEEMRQTHYRMPFEQASNRDLVAMHVRRGDEDGDQTRIKMSPNSYYLNLAEQIKRAMPLADIHIFSSLENGTHKESSFNEFKERGMQVHLDEVGPASAWSWFAHAAVFVMGPSVFSNVGALFNPNCVVGIDIHSETEHALPFIWSMPGDMNPKREPDFGGQLSKCVSALRT